MRNPLELAVNVADYTDLIDGALGSLIVNVAKYTGLIEDHLSHLSDKVDQLADSELGAAVRHLKQAIDADCERGSLLRDARRCFTRAIELEKDLRLVAAYLGLALCHAYLGDRANAKNALLDLSCIRYDTGKMHRFASKVVKLMNTTPGKIAMVVLLPVDGLGAGAWLTQKVVKRAIVKPGDERVEELAKFRTAACKLLESVLTEIGTKRVPPIAEVDGLPMLEKYRRRVEA
jgi:hypothetical protein